LSVLFSYFVLGISLAAPIGPINAAQIDKGIKNGFLHSWLIGIGSIVADFIYMLVVYLGVVNFLHTPFMKTFLWTFGAFILLYTGIESLLNSGKIQQIRDSKDASYLKTFLTGFLMSISSPLTILFWLGIYGSVLAETVNTYDHKHLIIYSATMFAGLLVWDVSMAALSSSFRRFLTNKLLIFISLLSGFSLIGFGVYFGWQAIKILFHL
jgi:L-lysine exporter family protein LysE/ArgO